MSPDDEVRSGASGPESPVPAESVADPCGEATRTTVTFYLSDALRNRARAAYRSTSHLESDRSWSEMVGKALLAEVRRREAAHNEGQAFVGTTEPLAPGRPVGA